MFLKKISLLIYLFLGFNFCSSASHSNQPLPTVSYVNLDRYLGTWFEIAKIPNRFQKNCLASRATYSLNKNGTIKVFNECSQANGEIDSATGKAKVKDKNTNAKLKVTFTPFFGFLFAADYWILDLGKNYEYVLVGNKSRKYLWILSRTPTLDSATYAQLLTKAQSLGFDVKKIAKTPIWSVN